MTRNVAFILQGTYNHGGMERMLAIIASEMCKFYKVTVITAFNCGRADGFAINKACTRVDLNINERDHKSPDVPKLLYRQYLSDYLHSHPQDIVVSLGSMEFFFLPSIHDGSKKVFWFHFAKNVDILTCHATHIEWLDKAIGWTKMLRRTYYACKYDRVVALTQADAKSWRRYTRRVTQIYNPVTVRKAVPPDYTAKRVIAVGRLDRQKGFDYLVDAWRMVSRRYPDWSLDIYGSGDQRLLQQQIDNCGLHVQVSLKGNAENISEEYARHSLLVMSSRYEGFSLVLVEASTCGLPLVAYDCQHGPAEILENGVNGLLIPRVGDIAALASAIEKMIGDECLRRQMGEKAEEMSRRFDLYLIIEQWRELLDNL